MFEFDWDPAKAASNLRKHKVGFELAATVFRDPLMQSILDGDHSEFEQRWITMATLGTAGCWWCPTPTRRPKATRSRCGSSRLAQATRNEQRQFESGE